MQEGVPSGVFREVSSAALRVHRMASDDASGPPARERSCRSAPRWRGRPRGAAAGGGVSGAFRGGRASADVRVHRTSSDEAKTPSKAAESVTALRTGAIAAERTREGNRHVPAGHYRSAARTADRNSSNSGGSGTVNSIRCPVRGWTNPRWNAWSRKRETVTVSASLPRPRTIFRGLP